MPNNKQDDSALRERVSEHLSLIETMHGPDRTNWGIAARLLDELAALSPQGSEPAGVVIGANDVHWFEDAFRAWGNDDFAGVLDGLTAAVNHFNTTAQGASDA